MHQHCDFGGTFDEDHRLEENGGIAQNGCDETRVE